MSFSLEEKVNLLFKKNFGKPSTRNELPFYQELNLNAYSAVFSDKIWAQSTDIPSSVPSSLSSATTDDDGNTIVGSLVGKSNGVIRRYEKVPLTHISGSLNNAYAAYDGSSNIITKNTIPFNFDPLGTYLYTIYKNDQTTVISFGDGEWVLDIDSGGSKLNGIVFFVIILLLPSYAA